MVIAVFWMMGFFGLMRLAYAQSLSIEALSGRGSCAEVLAQ
jgi:hypothetical protein